MYAFCLSKFAWAFVPAKNFSCGSVVFISWSPLFHLIGVVGTPAPGAFILPTRKEPMRDVS